MHDEVNLRDIVKVVWTGKFILMTFLLAGLLSSILFNYVKNSEKIYESTSLVTVNALLDEKMQVQKKDYTPFIQQVKSEAFIRNMLQQHNLSDSVPGNILRNLKVEPIKDANTLKVSLKNPNPEHVVTLSNLISYELAIRIETSSRLDRMVFYTNQLNDVEDKILVTKQTVAESAKQLQDVSDKLITKKSLSEDPYLNSYVTNSTGNKATGSLQMVNEEINPLYITIKTIQADASINLAKLETEKANLTKRIEANQKFIDNPNNTNLEQLASEKIIQDADGYNAITITPALKSSQITGNTLLIMVLFIFLSSVCGLFILFIREYWRKTA
jgi:hypothetical protein